jgi:hypothetical protein
VYAMNLTHSPENVIVWVTADRVDLTRRPCVTPRHRRAVSRAPGVSDSIEPNNDSGAILACGEALGRISPEYVGPT